MPDDSNSEPIPGASGKKVVVAVLVGLVLIGGMISYTLWTYSRIDGARATVESRWRDLADLLSVRYRRVEKLVATGVDSREVSMAWGERFRLAVDRFRTSAQPSSQRQAAADLEQLIVSGPISGQSLVQPSDELVDSLAQFNAAARRRQQSQETLGGRLLGTVLDFPTLPELELPGIGQTGDGAPEVVEAEKATQ